MTPDPTPAISEQARDAAEAGHKWQQAVNAEGSHVDVWPHVIQALLAHQSAQHAEDTQQLQERVALYEQTTQNHMQTIAVLNEEIAKVRVERDAQAKSAWSQGAWLHSIGATIQAHHTATDPEWRITGETARYPQILRDLLDSLRAELAREKAQAIHVIPIGDTFPRSRINMQYHDASPECWCSPRLSDNRIYVHNAHDCREKYERQGRPQQPWMLIGGSALSTQAQGE